MMNALPSGGAFFVDISVKRVSLLFETFRLKGFPNIWDDPSQALGLLVPTDETTRPNGWNAPFHGVVQVMGSILLFSRRVTTLLLRNSRSYG